MVTNGKWNSKCDALKKEADTLQSSCLLFQKHLFPSHWQIKITKKIGVLVWYVLPTLRRRCCALVLSMHFLLKPSQGLHAGWQAFDVQVLWYHANALSVKFFCCPSAWLRHNSDLSTEQRALFWEGQGRAVVFKCVKVVCLRVCLWACLLWHGWNLTRHYPGRLWRYGTCLNFAPDEIKDLLWCNLNTTFNKYQSTVRGGWGTNTD